MTEKILSLSDMMSARCSQADFARLFGLTRGRIHQLVKAGLIPCDDNGGVKLVDGVKIFATWRQVRRHYDLTVEEFFARFGDMI